MSDLAQAVRRGQDAGKLALYFGCWDQPGHYLHSPGGATVRHKERERLEVPWDDALMDTGLLKNGKRADSPDGRVWWTAGGLTFWYAFFWWDRSVDTRGACNSGFYVRGFGWPEIQDAFDYACEIYPQVVARQKYPLVLQEPYPPLTIASKELAP